MKTIFNRVGSWVSEKLERVGGEKKAVCMRKLGSFGWGKENQSVSARTNRHKKTSGEVTLRTTGKKGDFGARKEGATMMPKPIRLG